MNLKNYLFEYVSSGRNRRKSGHPVEPDTVLKVGDVVRIKDKEWFDSLEKDDCGEGVIRYVGDRSHYILFTRPMIKYLGCEVEIVRSYRKSSGEPRYRVRLYDNNLIEMDNYYTFTNEMLEYI